MGFVGSESAIVIEAAVPPDPSHFESYFAKAGAGKTAARFKKNDIVYSQGDPAESIFYIQKGRVKLNVTSEHGKEAVVAVMEAGQFFGEGCLNGDIARVATAVSMGDSALVSISKQAMREALKNEPNFAQLFVTYLLTRNSRVEEDFIISSISYSIPASDGLRDFY